MAPVPGEKADAIGWAPWVSRPRYRSSPHPLSQTSWRRAGQAAWKPGSESDNFGCSSLIWSSRALSSMTQAEADRYSALLREGLALHRSGQLTEAAALYIQVLDKFPNHPDTLDLHGVLLHQAGQNGAALDFLNRAVQARPEDAGFHNHLGACLRALGLLDQARQAFTTACTLRSDMPEAALNLATVLNQLTLYEQAETVAREAIRLAPAGVDPRLALVVALNRRERHRDAAAVLMAARRSLAPDIRVLEQLAQQFSVLGETQVAGDAARRAVLFQPNTSNAYVFLNELNSKIAWARRATHLAPGDWRLWTNLSNLHALANENGATIHVARHAMVLSPGNGTAYVNMTTSAMRIFDLTLARSIAYRGMAIDPGLHVLAICASECERSRGNIAKGWALYERRGLLSEALPRLGLPPAWDRVGPPDGPLLVCAEQGVGDEFIFLNCLPDLLSIADDVIVECDQRCLPLFQRTFPTARWIPRTVRETRIGHHAWDYRGGTRNLKSSSHIMAASLPALFHAGAGRPAAKNGYLRVDPEEAAAWRSWLASLSGLPKVGVSWRSGVVDPLHEQYYFTPELLLDSIGASTATFISLLYADTTEEIAGIRKSHDTVIHEPPGLYQRDELDRLAALISELDMVIAADTSVCAMAAASGVRTIRLEASYMLLANGADALFENLYPCRDTEVPFSRDAILRRASGKFNEWMGELKDRRRITS
jgi:Flp pilus assembly protein TadD